MATEAAYDYTTELADGAPLAIFRLNPYYRRIIAGAARDLASPFFFNGTDQQKTDMAAEMLVCAQQIELDYECPPQEGEMRNVIQASYVLPANTQTGGQLTFNAYNQFLFNTLVGDTTGVASLETPGGLIVPAGNWLLSLVYFLYYSSGAMPLKVTHSESDIIFSDHIIAQGAPTSLKHVVSSDAETQIKVWINPRGNYCYWGYSYAGYDVARVVGTLTLEELPS